MKHKFFILEDEEVLSSSKWFLEITESQMKEKVSLYDDIIVNNPLFFKGFKSFKVSFKNPGEGLDYCGVTIIPSSSMGDFQKNLIKVKRQKNINDQLKKPIDDLIILTKKVAEKGLYLIHFGI